jgi:hypothetical protein
LPVSRRASIAWFDLHVRRDHLRLVPTSTGSACMLPCECKHTTASGWSSCAATSPGRRYRLEPLLGPC